MIRWHISIAFVLASTAIGAAQPIDDTRTPEPTPPASEPAPSEPSATGSPTEPTIAPAAEPASPSIALRKTRLDRKSALIVATLAIAVPVASALALVPISGTPATSATRVAGLACVTALLVAPTLGSYYAGVPWDRGSRCARPRWPNQSEVARRVTTMVSARDRKAIAEGERKLVGSHPRRLRYLQEADNHLETTR